MILPSMRETRCSPPKAKGIERLAVVGRTTHVEEKGSPHSPKKSDRRDQRIDQRESQLGIAEETAMSDEPEIRVTPHVTVSPEPEKIRVLAHALEAPETQSEQAPAGKLEVLTGIDVDRTPRQKGPTGRETETGPHRAPRKRPELAEAGCLLNVGNGQR